MSSTVLCVRHEAPFRPEFGTKAKEETMNRQERGKARAFTGSLGHRFIDGIAATSSTGRLFQDNSPADRNNS